MAKYETICSPKNLFVPFSHQTICSSETICSSSSVKTADDKALFLWKKGELIEFSGTLRGSSVCKFKVAFLVAYNPQLI